MVNTKRNMTPHLQYPSMLPVCVIYRLTYYVLVFCVCAFDLTRFIYIYFF